MFRVRTPRSTLVALLITLLTLALGACASDDDLADAGAPEADAEASTPDGATSIPDAAVPDADSSELARIVFVRQPATVAAGVPLAVEVQVRDALGAPLDSAPPVALALASGPAGVTLMGTTLVTPTGGLAIFDDLRLEHAGHGLSLVASVPGLVSVQSIPFDVVAGAATAARSKLIVTPRLVDVGSPIQVTAILHDAFDNPVPAHTVALTTTGRSNTLTPPAGLTDSSGTFTTAWTSTHAETKTVRWHDDALDLRAEARFKLPACYGPVALPGPPAAAPVDSFGFASADFDGDGLTDVAVLRTRADLTGYEVWLYLQGEHAVFARGPTLQLTGAALGAVVAADFDGDGQRDLLIGGNQTELYRGLGDGTFTLSDAIPSSLSARLLTADLDGNGRPEVLAFSYYNDLQVFSVAQDGAIEAGAIIPVDGRGESATLADFDGDGNLDVALSASAGYLAVHAGHGDGTFATSVRTPQAGVGTDLAAGDFDGDGHPDLATSGFVTKILRGNGDGTFGAALALPSDGMSPLTAADVTGDGKADLLGWQDSAHRLALAAGNGDGSLTYRYYNADAVHSPPVATDVDADGDLDVLTFTPQNIGLLLGDGAGGLVGAEAAPDAARGIGGDIATGDFDQDGAVDSVYVDSYGTITELFGRGADGGRRVVTLTPPVGVFGHVVATDFTGDGVLDLVATDLAFSSAYVLREYVGNGLGDFAPAASPSYPNRVTQLQRGDVDGDHFGDVVLKTEAGVLIAYGSVDGLSVPALVPGFGTTGALVVADVDEDGRDDIVALGESSTASIAHGRSDRSVAVSQGLSLGQAAQTIHVGDVDGDGHLDLVVGRGTQADVSVGHGNGTFDAPGAATTLEPYSGLTVGDLNSDGRADLIASSQSRGVQVLTGRANGTLASPFAYGVGGQGSRLALADFDGDGDVDLLTTALDARRPATFWQRACLAPTE